MNFRLFQLFMLIPINAFGAMLGLWMLKSNISRSMKRWFLLMTVFMLLWVNFAYLGLNSTTLRLAPIWYKINYVAVSMFLPAFYYFFVVHFLKNQDGATLLGKIILGASALFALISLFTDLIVGGVVLQSWGMEIVFGPLSLLFNLFAASVAIIIVYYSLQAYSSSSIEVRHKLRLFLAGMLIFIIANLTFNVGSQIFFQSVQYQIFGDFSAIFLLGFTAYSIVRYELFDVKVVATEALTFVIWMVLLARLFVADSIEQRIVDGVVLFLTVIFGVMLIRSVKREVQQREELEKLTKQLKHIDRQKDEFVSMAAHELRAPMTAIKGYLSMVLEGDAGDIPPKARGYIADVRSITDRLTRLVNNMLNVSRIEEGRLVYQVEIISLSRVAQMVFAQFKIEAERKGLEMELDIPGDLRDRVKVDVDRIQEVMANFVSNAVKYTDEGKVIMRLRQSGDEKVRFEVEDTGPGISKEEQKKLFQKFYRAESNVGKTIGTGLGLYICKLLIDNFKGELGLESEPEKGSIFWFELPIVEEKEGE